ncbi:hypothetical protein SEA_MAGRITTE_132 [Microbacterium phage Magritte]|nr:hypothetical protein SEA_MAGRITTE_132 [Microbacterium phage Magritte]
MTVTLSLANATNMADTIIVVPQEKPAEITDVHTEKVELYWFQGPFRMELVGTKERMDALIDHPLYQNGWWERKTRVSTTVTERL